MMKQTQKGDYYRIQMLHQLTKGDGYVAIKQAAEKRNGMVWYGIVGFNGPIDTL